MPTDYKEIYERYRFRVQNENELVHYRMSWFIPLQSFLFISLAIFSNGELTEEIGPLFLRGISLIGSISALATLLSVGSAISTMRTLEAIWDTEFQKKTEGYQFPPLMGGFKSQKDEIEKRAAILGIKWPNRRATGTAITFGMPIFVLGFWIALGVLGPDKLDQENSVVGSYTKENSGSSEGTKLLD